MLFISQLAKDEESKARLIHSGIIEQVGYIELGMCPLCQNSIQSFATIEERNLFDKTGLCGDCQRKTVSKVQELFDKYKKYIGLENS